MLVALGCAFLAAQALPLPEQRLPISGELEAPHRVREILRAACDDCHSSRTRWPWYADLAPASWLVHTDVIRGRQRLDFSNWEAYAADPGTAVQKLRNIQRELRDGAMPPPSYRLVHPEARLTPAQRSVLLHWAADAIAASPAAP